MKARYLFVENECPHCGEYLWVIDSVNSRLPIGSIINIIDVTNFRDVGIIDNPIIEKFNLEDVPLLYLDGIKILGVSSRAWIEGFLNSYFQEEFLA